MLRIWKASLKVAASSIVLQLQRLVPSGHPNPTCGHQPKGERRTERTHTSPSGPTVARNTDPVRHRRPPTTLSTPNNYSTLQKINQAVKTYSIKWLRVGHGEEKVARTTNTTKRMPATGDNRLGLGPEGPPTPQPSRQLQALEALKRS